MYKSAKPTNINQIINPTLKVRGEGKQSEVARELRQHL